MQQGIRDHHVRAPPDSTAGGIRHKGHGVPAIQTQEALVPDNIPRERECTL